MVFLSGNWPKTPFSPVLPTPDSLPQFITEDIHAKFAEHFNCKRIIHQLEVNEGTSDCETILKGEGDWQIKPELKGIFTPGHTAGHVCFLYKGLILFSGDHLFYSRHEQQVKITFSGY